VVWRYGAAAHTWLVVCQIDRSARRAGHIRRGVKDAAAVARVFACVMPPANACARSYDGYAEQAGKQPGSRVFMLRQEAAVFRGRG